MNRLREMTSGERFAEGGGSVHQTFAPNVIAGNGFVYVC